LPDYLKAPATWLVGAGPMALDYAKVLTAQKVSYVVVGRGEESAKKFRQISGVEVLTGGVEKALLASRPFNAIVTVGVGELAATAGRLIDAGVSRILVEKPAGLTAAEVLKLSELARRKDAEVFVAYNRRFYRSVMKAREIIQADGGVSSFHFDFTEWSHVIAPSDQKREVKENWLLANSSHVIDLAFFLGGCPRELTAYHGGTLDWHPRGSRYCGSGRTETGSLFSYQADWKAPGRWGVDIRTEKHRLILQPLEGLSIQKIGSVVIEAVALETALDKEFKPGLYLQTRAFLAGENNEILQPLAAHAKFCAQIIQPIMGES
jgi:predicted dehydrogenase